MEALKLNGPSRRAPRSRKSTDSSPRTIRRARSRKLSACQRVSLAVGAVACFVLALSVYHCTEAIAALTGSPLALAMLLAIGIDCGMVSCELATVVGNDRSRRWATSYIVLAVVLSSALNSFASGEHAESARWLAYIVGALVPVCVFILAKVSAHLWAE